MIDSLQVANEICGGNISLGSNTATLSSMKLRSQSLSEAQDVRLAQHSFLVTGYFADLQGAAKYIFPPESGIGHEPRYLLTRTKQNHGAAVWTWYVAYPRF